MTSIYKLHALSGVMGETHPAYILQIDEFRFLLDPGWNEGMDMDYIQNLQKYLHKIDCVLLSHSDPYHLGALPYLVGKCGLSCPVYATIPVFKMGQMFMYDWYLNRSNTEDFDLFNLDDVDSAFDKILQLEYNRTVNLKGRGLGISITAVPAGHSLGGCVWRISKSGEQDVYYAIDHNNKKERHLNGFEHEKIMGDLGGGGIFITNALNALYVQEKRRKRDDLLLGTIQQTMRHGGNCLVATDTAGRALELILMIDQMWRAKDLLPYSLVFMNNMAFNVIEFAKSQVDWMSEKLIKAFETGKVNPFQLKNVIVCHTMLELNQIASPKVVVTSSADLECGFARDLFLQWCQDPLSSVILTYRSTPGTLGRLLIDGGVSKGTKLNLEMRQKVKLEGKELEEYLEKKRKEKRKQIDVIEVPSSDEEDEPSIVFHSIHNQKRSQQAKNNNHITNSSMFPTLPSKKKRRFDDYGEVINKDAFQDKEENEDNNKTVKRRKSESLKDLKDDENNSPPMKTLRIVQPFSINCQVQFIDFEGRTDIEALLKILQDIKPRQLVILRGTPQATIAFDALVQKLLPDTKIFKPSLRRTCDLTSENSQLLQVKLPDSLMSSLILRKVKDYEVAWVDGCVEEGTSQSQDEMQNGVPFLNPMEDEDFSPPRPPMVLNRLRLSELRILLEKNGIQCEIKDKTIHCSCKDGGMVYILKDPETHSIHLECDGLPEEYYPIRDLVYSQMAFL